MGDQQGNREESRMTCKPYDIPKTLIWEAWLHVKANQGAAGIDAETLERFEKKLGNNLYKLWNRMSSGSHVPPPVKAVSIPKKSGGVRILGIRQDRADDGEDVAGANLPLREWFLASVVEARAAGAHSDLPRVASHSRWAISNGSIFTASHHFFSLLRRWRSRWWTRQRGTVNSSLTLRPSARGCPNRTW
jgi:hypothetical protein